MGDLKEDIFVLHTVIDVAKATAILKLLGDKTRLTMLKLINNQACCVCEFVEIIQVSQPSISQHLRKIKELEVKGTRISCW